MTKQASFHAPHGGSDFLGWRNRAGQMEIIYDDGVARRMVWRVAGQVADTGPVSDALRVAVCALRVVPQLYEELRKRAISVEPVSG